MESSLYIIKTSPRGSPSSIFPFVSSREYSPASTVAEFSSHDAGRVCIAASVDHFTFQEKGTVASVILRATRKERNALTDTG